MGSSNRRVRFGRRRRRLLGLPVVAVLVALFAASTASASHTHTQGAVTIYKNGVEEVATYRGATTSCVGTLCTATVNVSNRDYGRVQRWCPSLVFPIEDGATGDGVICPGTGPWHATVQAFLLSGCPACVPATHGSTVTVEVVVAKL